jgi:hypothetical protein
MQIEVAAADGVAAWADLVASLVDRIWSERAAVDATLLLQPGSLSAASAKPFFAASREELSRHLSQALVWTEAAQAAEPAGISALPPERLT